MGNAAVDIEKLSPAERLDLIARLWESLAALPADLTQADRSELGRRARQVDDDLAGGRPLGRPWAEVLTRLQAKISTT